MNSKYVVLIAVALTASPVAAYAAPIIVNGSFEDTTGMGGGGGLFNGVPVGWTFSGIMVQVLGSSSFPVTGTVGNNYLESFAASDLGTLSQTITGLTIGTVYDVSFLLGNRFGDYNVIVGVGGSSFSQTGTGLTAFSQKDLVFTAASTAALLSITWNAGTAVSGAFDDFKIREVGPSVPEPTHLALLSAGIAALAFRRRGTAH